MSHPTDTPTTRNGQPTIIDVARLAGVATSTASMALNGNTAIKAATREKVEKAAETLGYVPNQMARRLLGQKTCSIGALQWPSLNPLYTENSLILMRLAAQMNYHFRLFWNDIHQPETVRPLVQAIHGSVDGVILYNPSNLETQKLLIEQFRRCRTPFVFSAYLDAPDVDFVTSDIRSGARLAMEHLLAKGHREIATFSSPRQSLCEQGICDALARYNLEFRPDCHVRQTLAHYRDAYEIAMQLLKRTPAPTAVFARSDFVALAVIRAACDLGMTPGKDLEIVSMDNTEQSAYYVPSLTTVDFNKQEKNRLLLDILMKRISGQEMPLQQIYIKPELILRESTINERISTP